MKLNNGNIMVETLIALMVAMIIVQVVFSLKQLDLVKKAIVVKYEQGL